MRRPLHIASAPRWMMLHNYAQLLSLRGSRRGSRDPLIQPCFLQSQSFKPSACGKSSCLSTVSFQRNHSGTERKNRRKQVFAYAVSEGRTSHRRGQRRRHFEGGSGNMFLLWLTYWRFLRAMISVWTLCSSPKTLPRFLSSPQRQRRIPKRQMRGGGR